MTQANTPNFHNPLGPLCFDRDGLYPQELVVAIFGIAKTTLGKWHARGLRHLRPGTNKVYYLGSDIIKFFDSLPPADKEKGGDTAAE